MYVANESLCRELYTLSGWKTAKWWNMGSEDHNDEPESYWVSSTPESMGAWPAYDLGYVLLKLPQFIETINKSLRFETPACNYVTNEWAWFYENTDIWCEADTPENALVRLAIELIKAGIIPKEK